jgi:hypothetical protein
MRRCAPLVLAASFVALAVLSPRPSHAFFGFYVAPSDQPLYNDATMVALMRDGTRTVMSMSNNYRGPATDFAMVVPVPVVLQKENVKTLKKEVFTKLEALTAPRLVEYWEQDPCAPALAYEAQGLARKGAGGSPPPGSAGGGKDYGVTIEAKFTVGEYDILILSAKESDGLERWLVDNKYNIPKGASGALAPYIKEGLKFFVAKVDIKKVVLDKEGVAVLSPLRFSYESTDFRLPVRLGLLNAKAKQDLIVWILNKEKRFEVTNYPNAFIPTNLDVTEETRTAFAPFYATLFDATIAKAGGKAVVTEYAWTSSGCDPCPTPPLEDSDVATLGGDVLLGMGAPPADDPSAPPKSGLGKGMGFFGGGSHPMVLTRLHARYDATTLSDDLVFRAADPVVGGREFMQKDGELEKGSRPDSYNNFQARYAIRHPWAGKITCDSPRRGVWGGPPSGTGSTPPTAATGLASVPRSSTRLASHVVKGLDDLASWDKAAGFKADEIKYADKPAAAKDATAPAARKACGCEVPGQSESWGMGAAASVCALAVALARRSRTPRK